MKEARGACWHADMLELLGERIRVGGLPGADLRLVPASKGRFREEFNVEVVLFRGRLGERLMSLKVFCGRRPYWRPWIEAFNVSPEISSLGAKLADSPVEDAILAKLTERLPTGGSLYMEYYWDPETTRLLETGAPVAVTRIGYKLLKLGYSWFKLWYYPEGLMEGGQKIQATKSPETLKKQHLESILSEVKDFKAAVGEPKTSETLKALVRAEEIIEKLGNL